MLTKTTIHKIGNQIVLRDWNIFDVKALEKWLSVGKKWQELDGPYYKKTQNGFEKQIRDIQQCLDNKILLDPRSRVVIADKDTNKLLGTVSCYWESVETNWLCAGIAIYDPEYWGKGIGFESLGLWTEYLFQNYPKIVRLDLRTWSGNIGLIKLANKLGFIQEACFRKARIVDGIYFDSIGLGILKEEFEAKFPDGFVKFYVGLS
jgi:RimJ/RimL family protein N-acetyltransferase